MSIQNVCSLYLKASPLPPAPQLTGDWKDLQEKQDWQGAGWGQFQCPKLSFGEPGVSFLAHW